MNGTQFFFLLSGMILMFFVMLTWQWRRDRKKREKQEVAEHLKASAMKERFAQPSNLAVEKRWP
jgi:cytochrome oxidase assembly protein ShyY1